MEVAGVDDHVGGRAGTDPAQVVAICGRSEKLRERIEALARELGRSNVNVNAVAPGLIETDMMQDAPQKVIDAALAEIVRAQRPDVIHLQEVALWRRDRGGGLCLPWNESHQSRGDTMIFAEKPKKIRVMFTPFRDGLQSSFGGKVRLGDFLPAMEASVEAGIRHFEFGGEAIVQAYDFSAPAPEDTSLPFARHNWD